MSRKRKLPDGMVQRGSVYYACFGKDGRMVRKRLSTDFDAARSMLIELRSRADRAEFDLLNNDYPLDQLRDEYLRSRRQQLRPRTVRRYQENLNNVFDWLPIYTVSGISVDLMEQFRDERRGDGVTARTINMDTQALSTMLNWAVKRQKIGSNPISDLRPLDHHAKACRGFSTEEVSRLLGAATPHYRDIWYAYLTTGLRKMELADLLFRDVDWRSREIIVRAANAKGKRERRIPVDDDLFAIITRHHREASRRTPGARSGKSTTKVIRDLFTREHVFVTQQSTPLGVNLWREFIATCRRAKIETRTHDANGRLVEFVDLHSCRHTYASDLISNGVDPKTCQELLGHRTLAMTMQVYAKSNSQSKREAVGRLSYGSGVNEQAGVVRLEKRA